MTSELFTQAVISRSSHVFSQYSLKPVEANSLNDVAVRYFSRLSDKALILYFQDQPC